MHSNAKTLIRFYKAFAQLDAATMASCYAENASFQDPAFTLKGREQIGGMWNMLCSATKDKGMAHWKLEFSDIQADDAKGSAHWEAHYLFSATGKNVHNIIDGKFSFTPDGFIATHNDHFDFWRWSRQALGLPGLLLGWTPLLKMMVQKQASSGLQKFIANRKK
jgi:hypothetical protein